LKEKKLSHYKRRLTSGLIWYGFLSLGLVPVFTLMMGTKANIFTTSMSAMGNAGGGTHLWFILWTIVFCAVFSSFIGYLLMLTRNTHSKVRILVYFAVAVLIFGNIIPFLPDTFPGFAWLHNFCAQISSISLAVTLMLFTLTLRNHYSQLFKKALVFVLIIWVVLIALMGLFGTKSITEMSGILLACVFLFTVLIWLYQENTFDPVLSLQEFDTANALEEAEKLEKRAKEAKEEYLKLEAKARNARIAAEEAAYLAKLNKSSS